MANQRAITLRFSGAANANDQLFAFAYPSEFDVVHVTGLYVDTVATRFQVGLKLRSYEIGRWATNLFAAGNGRVHVEFDWRRGSDLNLLTNDDSATAHANCQAVLFFDVDRTLS